jgi:hypothetical protein
VYGSSVDLDGVTAALLLWQRADLEEAGVRLRWAVSDAIEATRFSIDRSDGEGLAFREIGEVVSFSSESLDYFDANPPDAPRWSYRIRTRLWDGTEITFDPVMVEFQTQGKFRWVGLAPNPFRDRLECRLFLPVAGRAEVSLYSPSGRLVRNLFTGDLPAGSSPLAWSNLDRILSPGVYFLRAKFGTQVAIGRVVLMQ